MQCFAGLSDFKIKTPTVVAIGKFDGRHRGHQKLLREMKRIKKEYGYQTAVFTFETTPLSLVEGARQTVITTNLERRSNMEQMEIDYLVEYPFTEEIAHMQPEEFVKQILSGQMNAKAIVAGSDCGFGYKRSGNAELLRVLSSVYDYQLYIIEKEQVHERDISSSYIREELDHANIEQANALLGEPYAVYGTVVHGNHIGGRVLGFPTANILPPPQKHLPPFGVYVSRVLVDGQLCGGITNVGKKPTIQGDSPVSVETFLFDLNEDLYGKNICVQFLHYLRPEQKFESLELLKEQIAKDRIEGLNYLKEK